MTIPPIGEHQQRPPSLRYFHHCCRKASHTGEVESKKVDDSMQQPLDSRHLLDLAWADLPPARVKEGDFIAMKKDFTH